MCVGVLSSREARHVLETTGAAGSCAPMVSGYSITRGTREPSSATDCLSLSSTVELQDAPHSDRISLVSFGTSLVNERLSLGVGNDKLSPVARAVPVLNGGCKPLVCMHVARANPRAGVPGRFVVDPSRPAT